MLRFNLTRPAAAYLKEKLNLTPDEEEIALYGLQVIIYPLISLLSISLVGWLLGCLYTTLAATLTAAFLRLWSGGAHSRSPLTCTLLGAVVSPALGKTSLILTPHLSPFNLFIIVILGSLLSLTFVWRLAPVDSPAKPLLSPEYRQRMRRLSITSVFFIAAVQIALLATAGAPAVVLALSLGLWWQTFTLTRAGHRFATLIDEIISPGVGR
ncbi:accessory gene regulator ArgB-like protein [Neomoorella humiferrea]|uniref:Putative accessory protein regulator protein n=1 Tax=Neomoorella humiferrea TaxID=676965 RepID=A0A2T0AWI2_9FIRM|nr:accessory gene regulator B family protein [Moorella humiferrea]PRR75078.1 putative accessory protein regulator protein [Moorella humiferrea]